MRRLLLLAGLAAGLAALAGPARRARAEEEGTPARGWTLDTSATGGYRLVDVDGSKDKYREDYNLESGFRLFDLDVAGATRAPESSLLDRFHLQVETPGDEPLSRFQLSAADRTLYDLRVDFRRSKYFYEGTQLFEQAVAGDLRLDDLHEFDFTRTNGTVDLVVHAPRLPKLLFGYRLYERHGSGVSTVTGPGNETFLVSAPVDSVTNVGRLGTEFTALGTDVFLQQEYRRVARGADLGPVLTPQGVDPANGLQLVFYDNHQDEHIGIPATTVRLRRPLGERAEVTGAYFYSHADLGFDVNRLQIGTPEPGIPGTQSADGGGDATLDTHVADLGTSVALTERVRVNLTYRFNERSQHGSLDEQSTFGEIAAVTGDHVRINSVTGDIEATPRDDLSLRAGVRYARRDASFTQSDQDISTDDVGAIGSLRWRPWTFLDVFARYENVQIDDPFVVPGDPANNPPLPERQIALTFTNRGSLGFQLAPREWVSLRYEFHADSSENDTFAAHSTAFGNSVGLTVTPWRDLVVFAGYTRRDLSNEADILLAPLYGRTLSLQSGTEDVFVSELRWDFGVLGQRWSTGWNVAYVNSDQALRPNLEPGLAGRAQWDLDRIDGGAFLTLRNRFLEPGIEFRMIDYNEAALPSNDYRATIVVFKLTKRFSL